MRTPRRLLFALAAALAVVLPIGRGGGARAAPGGSAAPIVGGTPTEAVPAVVAIERGGGVMCTGALMAPHEVLTAAHCVVGAAPDELAIAVELAGARRVRIAVADVYAEGAGRDAATLVTIEAVPADPLRAGAGAEIGDEVVVIGYGRDDAGGSGAKRAGAARVVARRGAVYELAPAPALPCRGDSGGPVLDGDGAVIGIVVTGDADCERYARAIAIEALRPAEAGGCSAGRGANAGASIAIAIAAILHLARRRRDPRHARRASSARRAPLAMTIAILATSCAVDPPCPADDDAAEVIFDAGHAQVWDPWDTGFYGYSGIAAALIDRGVAVARTTEPLDMRLARVPPARRPRTVLVLGVAKYQRYRDAEVDAILAFVRGGGRALVVGEHDGMYGIDAFQAPLLAPAGLALGADAIGDATADEQRAHAPALGLDDVRVLLAASIEIAPEAAAPVVLLAQPGRGGASVPIAAGVSLGDGRLAAIGDSELWWNGNDGRLGLDAGDNRAFWLRTIAWLLDEPLPACAPPGVPAERADVAIDGAGRGLAGSSGAAALAAALRARGHTVCAGPACDADVRVILGPLAPVALDPDARAIVAVDAWDALDPGSYWDRRILDEVADRAPTHAWLAARGVTVLPAFVTTGDAAAPFAAHTAAPSAALHHAAPLAGLTPWIAAAPGAWGERTHPGMAGVGGEHGTPQAGAEIVRDADDVAAPIVAVFDARTLVIGDSDLLAPPRIEDPAAAAILDGIARWIARGDPR